MHHARLPVLREAHRIHHLVPVRVTHIDHFAHAARSRREPRCPRSHAWRHACWSGCQARTPAAAPGGGQDEALLLCLCAAGGGEGVHVEVCAERSIVGVKEAGAREAAWIRLVRGLQVLRRVARVRGVGGEVVVGLRAGVGRAVFACASPGADVHFLRAALHA